MPHRLNIYRNWHDLSKLRGARVALAVGIFDGIHRGHIQIFNMTRELAVDLKGIPLIFTFRNHPLQVLQPQREVRFLTLPEEKTHLLRKLGFEHVACFDFDESFKRLHALEFLQKLGEHVRIGAFVAGYDTTVGADRVSSDDKFRRIARQLNFEFMRIGAVTRGGEPISSRRIRELILASEIREANELLVYPYFVRGQVQAGRKVGGRVLGIPTANLLLPREKLLPPYGVYAGAYRKDKRFWPAALIITDAHQVPRFLRAQAPELAGYEEGSALVEGHVIGDGSFELTGRTAEFIFLEFIRERREFADANSLRTQIQQDIEDTKRIFEKSRIQLQFLP